MKWLPNGRMWFEPDEIEKTMEQELRKANLLPPLETPAVDLERLIQRHLGAALDQYADLEQGVLGKTEFYSDAIPKVFINRMLTVAVDEDDCPAGVKGRWRATMAHEAAHPVMITTTARRAGRFGRVTTGRGKRFPAADTRIP